MIWLTLILNILFFGFLVTVLGFSINNDNEQFMMIFFFLAFCYSIQIVLFILMLFFIGFYLSITFPF